MVNEGILEVGRGGSGYLAFNLSYWDQQWPLAFVCWLAGSISPLLHATYHYFWIELAGEV